MKRLRKIQTSILICLFFVLLFPYGTLAHGGNTDSYGGHKKNSNRTYHCHSGQCLEDARKEAYKIALPIGQKDGRLGKENGYEEYQNVLWERVGTGEIDSERAEYMIPYVLVAYKEGFKDTYIPPAPTFWEKYGGYIAAAPFLLWGIYFGVIIIFMVILTVIGWVQNVREFFR
ncbi:hypothetical protein MKY15_15695 [Sporosarcina sp. FSL K6-1540]|uniref:hypothetical protein n=1 Tax=Sporosarcina sp. FSL K6-1540 TaxID=2921555 RepID=UPI003159E8C4